MKAKKLMLGVTALSMCAQMTAVGVFAAEGSKDAEVSYNNTNEIPDPTNPDNPEWSVQIPSKLNFTEAAKQVNADVSIEAKNGGALPTKDVNVGVESSKGYKLSLDADGNEDAVAYNLVYAGTTMSTTVTAVGNLNATKPKIDGVANLLGTATKTGDHTDTLTYRVTFTK